MKNFLIFLMGNFAPPPKKLKQVVFKFMGLLIALTVQAPSSSAQDCANLPAFNQVYTNGQTVMTPTTFTNQNIRISGTVAFNASVTMVRCTLLLDPGAVLNINNSTFILAADAAGNRSVIFGCTSMWQAINVNVGSAIIFRNSTIQDGLQGIVFQQGFLPNLTEIRGCIFNRNAVCITAQNVNNFSFSSFSSNTFTGHNTFLGTPLFRQLPPFVPGNAANAFSLTNVTGVIGTAGTVNTIRRMTTGIRAVNSTLTVNNCTFSACRVIDPQNNGNGTGLGLNNCNLTIRNLFSNNASCTFTGCGVGISSNATRRFTVQQAAFAGQSVLDIDVFNSISNFYTVNISNNTFALTNPRIGAIALQRAATIGNGVRTRIQNNPMTLPAGGAAIANNIRFMNLSAQPNATDLAYVANNPITCAYGNGPAAGVARTIDGIWIQNAANGWQVSGNTINFINPTGPPNAAIFGVAIGMVNVIGNTNIVGPNNLITTSRFANQVNGQESWLRCGVHIDGSPTAAVCKNDSDDPRHAYHFTTNCAGIEFGRNIIRDAYYGLEINGFIPNNHDYRMNEWVPGSMYNTFSVSNTNPPLNFRWRVDGSGGNPLGYLPPNLPPNNMSPQNAVIDIPNNFQPQTPICDAVVPTPGFGEPPTGELVVKYLNGEYGIPNNTAAWDFERVLLGDMIRYPASFAGNAAAEAYYNGKLNSTIWKLAKAERMMHESMATTSTQQNQLDQWGQTMQALIDSIGLIEQWEGADTTAVNPEWQLAKKSLLEQIAAISAQASTVSNGIRAQQLENLSDVEIYVEAISGSGTLENNYQDILLLQLKQYSGEGWTNSDSTLLRAIAYSCLETGGEAVTIARGMLPAPESFSFVREMDDPNCGEERSNKVSAPQPELFVLWPNPVQEVLFVGFAEAFTGHIEVLNAAGQVVTSMLVENSIKATIPTGAINNGVYIVRASTSGQPTVTKKITIIH